MYTLRVEDSSYKPIIHQKATLHPDLHYIDRNDVTCLPLANTSILAEREICDITMYISLHMVVCSESEPTLPRNIRSNLQAKHLL